MIADFGISFNALTCHGLTVTCTGQLLHSAETSCHVFWGSLHSQTAQCTRHPGSDCFPQSHRDVKLEFHWLRCWWVALGDWCRSGERCLCRWGPRHCHWWLGRNYSGLTRTTAGAYSWCYRLGQRLCCLRFGAARNYYRSVIHTRLHAIHLTRTNLPSGVHSTQTISFHSRPCFADSRQTSAQTQNSPRLPVLRFSVVSSCRSYLLGASRHYRADHLHPSAHFFQTVCRFSFVALSWSKRVIFTSICDSYVVKSHLFVAHLPQNLISLQKYCCRCASSSMKSGAGFSINWCLPAWILSCKCCSQLG